MGKFGGADCPDGRRVADDSRVALDLRLVPEPETVSFVPVGKWPDGSPAPVMLGHNDEHSEDESSWTGRLWCRRFEPLSR